MRYTILFVVLSWLGTLPSVGVAADVDTDGDDLLRECEKVLNESLPTLEHGESFHCIGFVLGLLSMNAIYHRQGTAPLFCPPPTVTVGQGIRVTVTYLQGHPEKLHEDGGSLAVTALQHAFPCPLKRK